MVAFSKTLVVAAATMIVTQIATLTSTLAKKLNLAKKKFTSVAPHPFLAGYCDYKLTENFFVGKDNISGRLQPARNGKWTSAVNTGTYARLAPETEAQFCARTREQATCLKDTVLSDQPQCWISTHIPCAEGAAGTYCYSGKSVTCPSQKSGSGTVEDAHGNKYTCNGSSCSSPTADICLDRGNYYQGYKCIGRIGQGWLEHKTKYQACLNTVNAHEKYSVPTDYVSADHHHGYDTMSTYMTSDAAVDRARELATQWEHCQFHCTQQGHHPDHPAGTMPDHPDFKRFDLPRD
jgi:hypothetical protein